MLVTPLQIEKAALGIVNYWEESEALDEDKIVVLEMVRDFYADRDDHVFDQYLAQLATRMIERNVPKTGFENGKSDGRE